MIAFLTTTTVILSKVDLRVVVKLYWSIIFINGITYLIAV